MRKKSILRLFEKEFAIFVLFFSTAPIIPLFRIATEGDILYDGDPLIQVIWIVIYLVNTLLILLRWRRFVYVAKKNKLLLFITGLALVSVLWSADPIVTFRRSVALVGTTTFGIYLASRYSFKEQLKLLAWALGIAMLLSPLFVIVPPHYGIETRNIYAGVWRGIYFSKNSLGTFMSLSAVVFLLLAFSKDRHRWIGWICFSVSFALLILSSAKNPLICLLTVLVLLPIYRILRWHYSLRIPFLVALASFGTVVGTFCLSNMESVLAAMGKDATLTGRTELWYLLFNMGLQHPWLGYGYSGFWLGWDGPSRLIWSSLFWQPHHAHNGLMQLWLDLGLVGMFLFMLSFIKTSLKAVDWVRSTTTLADFWPLIYLGMFLLRNVSESEILAVNNTMWILYVAITCSMTLQSEQEKKSSYVSAKVQNPA
jgi:O-antigen ligase